MISSSSTLSHVYVISLPQHMDHHLLPSGNVFTHPLRRCHFPQKLRDHLPEGPSPLPECQAMPESLPSGITHVPASVCETIQTAVKSFGRPLGE